MQTTAHENRILPQAQLILTHERCLGLENRSRAALLSQIVRVRYEALRSGNVLRGLFFLDSNAGPTCECPKNTRGDVYVELFLSPDPFYRPGSNNVPLTAIHQHCCESLH